MAPQMKLYHAHTACTRVTLTALEQVGVPYEDHMIDFEAGENRTPEYRALNPQGKVPCLVVDGRPLTENGAILTWLDETWPEAGLLPSAQSDWDRAHQLSALLWIASGWHPYVRAVKVPFMWTTGDPQPVRERGGELFSGVLDQLDAELADRRWWFGDEWSIVDTYFWWAYINSEFGGFDLSKWKNVGRHRFDNETRPALQRALAREKSAWDELQARKK